MTKFQEKSFSVTVGGKKYGDGWDRTFGKKPKKTKTKKVKK